MSWLSLGCSSVHRGDCVIPCRPRGQRSQQPCASRQTRTRRDNGGSHPSWRRKQVSATQTAAGRNIGRGLVLHLVVEDLGLARLGLGDQGVVEHVEDILADLLEFLLNLLSVLANGGDVLVRALGLLLLLDRRDDAPRGTSCANDVLVGNGKQVALVYGELAANLSRCQYCALPQSTREASPR